VEPKTSAQVTKATCPDCGEKITIRGAVRIGQEVVCPSCDAELEVVETEPVELDWAYEDDYDDDDDDDDW
jgi:alpha-aminoadipate carrier protein LysW